MPKLMNAGDAFDPELEDEVYKYLCTLQNPNFKMLGGRIFKVLPVDKNSDIRIEIAVKDPREAQPEIKRYDYRKILKLMGRI